MGRNGSSCGYSHGNVRVVPATWTSQGTRQLLFASAGPLILLRSARLMPPCGPCQGIIPAPRLCSWNRGSTGELKREYRWRVCRGETYEARTRNMQAARFDASPAWDAHGAGRNRQERFQPKEVIQTEDQAPQRCTERSHSMKRKRAHQRTPPVHHRGTGSDARRRSPQLPPPITGPSSHQMANQTRSRTPNRNGAAQRSRCKSHANKKTMITPRSADPGDRSAAPRPCGHRARSAPAATPTARDPGSDSPRTQELAREKRWGHRLRHERGSTAASAGRTPPTSRGTWPPPQQSVLELLRRPPWWVVTRAPLALPKPSRNNHLVLHGSGRCSIAPRTRQKQQRLRPMLLARAPELPAARNGGLERLSRTSTVYA